MGLAEQYSSHLFTCNKLCSVKRGHGLMLYSLLWVAIDFQINGWADDLHRR